KIEKCNYDIQDSFNAKDFDDNLTSFRSQIGWQIAKGMFNLLDCHDLPRFYTLANENLALFKLGAILLFTYLGIPCVYYGDEIGLKGENETQSRACMNWDKNKLNQDIFSLYKTLIKLRKNSPALYAGGIKTIYKEENIYAFTRFYKKECLIIIINNNNQNRQITLPLWSSGIINKNFKEIFSSLNYQVKNGYLRINLNKYQGLILY
ncbi:MAG: alpha-glucosidase C-terminal domain-containing protein, partial [Armatimonadetes bacterium]|nr:alpha-glucosidase C-terminal domain-containing protein [Armatimonadota bacterium]